VIQPARPTGQPNVAVIGCGYWGANLVRIFFQAGSLVAVADDVDAVAQGAAATTGVPVRSVTDLLADPDVDAVVVATPAATHAQLAIDALDAGKHVFVEKPLALHVSDAERVVDAAQRAGRILMVGHLLRYHPAFVALQTLVAEGELGRLRYIYSNRLNFGRFRRVENILWSFSPHDISMILSLVGSEPDEVSAVASSYLQENVADVTTTHLSFPGGEGAHVFVSWLHPYKEQRLVVVGDQAMAVFDDGLPWNQKLRLYAHQVTWRDGMPEAFRADGRDLELTAEEPLARECRHFLDSITAGTPPLTDGEEGLRVLRVLEAAETSISARPLGTPQRSDRRADGLIRRPSGALVQETAVIDAGAELAAGTRVWHFSHILHGTRIGENSVLGQNVMVGPNVTVGNRCKIQNNVSVYEGVEIDDDVFCGPSAVFTNVLIPRADVDRKAQFVPTRVRRGASIGANATIICGTELGERCLIGAGAVVTRDVPPHALMVGSPAHQVGWVSHSGARLDDDLRCPETGVGYRLVEGALVVLE